MSEQVKQIAMRIQGLRPWTTRSNGCIRAGCIREEYRKIETGEIDILISFPVKVARHSWI